VRQSHLLEATLQLRVSSPLELHFIIAEYEINFSLL